MTNFTLSTGVVASPEPNAPAMTHTRRLVASSPRRLVASSPRRHRGLGRGRLFGLYGTTEERTALPHAPAPGGSGRPGLPLALGRLVKGTGDGFLVEFATPVSALNCAVEIQSALPPTDDMRIRIGINLGDIIVEPDGDVYGDKVNVAVRLDTAVEAGGIFVSTKIYDEVQGRVSCHFALHGELALQNIERPARAYAVLGEPSIDAAAPAPGDRAGKLPSPQKPSIAVRPYQNLDGDATQRGSPSSSRQPEPEALAANPSQKEVRTPTSSRYDGRLVERSTNAVPASGHGHWARN